MRAFDGQSACSRADKDGWDDLKAERADFKPELAYLRSEREYKRSDRADMRLERPYLRPERLERPDLRLYIPPSLAIGAQNQHLT